MQSGDGQEPLDPGLWDAKKEPLSKIDEFVELQVPASWGCACH